jgi:Mrp family chromosome partitioning ATPase
MRGGRRKLPVLAELSGPAPGESRAWSLRRGDLEQLARVQGTLEPHRAVLVAGAEAPAAALGLAGAACAAGRRTVLVECDLARPRLAADLGLASLPGLHEYLRWESTAPRILQPLVLAGPGAGGAAQALVCIPAGRPAADPATLLGLASFRHALTKLRSAYDLVVLAGPALDGGDGALEAAAAQADTLLAAVAPEIAAGAAGRRLRSSLRRLPLPTQGLLLVGG